MKGAGQQTADIITSSRAMATASREAADKLKAMTMYSYESALLARQGLADARAARRTTIEQTSRIIKANEGAPNGIQQSARSAKDALAATVEMARNEQRAWVGPTLWQPVNIAEKSDLQATVGLTNSGKTPALNVVVNHRYVPVRKGEELNPSHDPDRIPLDEAKLTHSVIQPGALQREIGVFDDLPNGASADMVAKLKSGDVILYIYGRISYKDCFGRSHKTTFAGAVDGKDGHWYGLPKWNYADERPQPYAGGPPMKGPNGPDKTKTPKPRPKRLSLHPLTPHDALRHALTAGKVEKRKKAPK
jgi:hypothetical protein